MVRCNFLHRGPTFSRPIAGGAQRTETYGQLAGTPHSAREDWQARTRP